MSKRISILIAIVFITSIGIVLALYAWSESLQQTAGSFLRSFPTHPVVEEDAMPIAHDSYYFAGASGEHVYLAHHKVPRHLLRVHRSLHDTAHITLQIADIHKHKSFRVDVVIDSPYFYFMDGTVPYAYRGYLDEWRAENILCDSTYFLTAVPVSSSSAGLHAFSRITREDELGKKTWSQRGATLNNTLLQKQIDGSFCVDGDLAFNRHLNKLIYLYRYRNEYSVMDTTMSLQYRAHTLDTFSRARVVFDTVHSTGAVHLAAPPPIVNKRFTMYRQWLFVHSNVPARNEDNERFRKGSVIDVYDLTTRTYRFSFYINDVQGERMKDFIITDHTLFALFDHTLTRYSLSAWSFARDNHNDTKPVGQE